MSLIKLNATYGLTGTLPAVSGANLTNIDGGKILQSVSATDTNERSTTSTSFVTISNTLTVNITPSATSSKIFVTVSTSLYSYTTNKSAYLTIYRDSTNLGNAQGLIRSLNQNGTGGGAGTCAVLDSPSTTSQVTYQVYMRADSSSSGASVNANTSGFITAFEVGA